MASRVHSAVVQVGFGAVGVGSLQISLPQNGGESGQAEYIGTAEHTVRSVELTALVNNTALGQERFAFADGVQPQSGTDAPLSRLRGVTLLDYTSRFDEPVGAREFINLPPMPTRYKPVAYGIDKPLGSDLPDGEECEEKARSASISYPAASQSALRIAGMDVKIIPGPGYVSRDVDDEYSTAGKTIGQVLSELLFTNGVRWWLEGDLVVVDGRALPTSSFDVPLNDKNDVADHSWSDELAGTERAPLLADYIARCAENIVTDEGVAGTFETNDNGTYDFFEASGGFRFGAGDDEGDYASVRGSITKSGGQIVSRFEEGSGFKSVPRTFFGGVQEFGPTYVKTLNNDFHSLVPSALVKSTERTRTYADMGVLQGLELEGGNATELQATLFYDLQLQSPYISEEKVVSQRWNAEGLLRRRSEITREFSGVAVQYVATEPVVALLYKDGFKVETWTPVGGGKYEYYASGYTMVDQPAYEVQEDSLFAPEPVGIVSSRTPFSFREETDSPPPSVSIPLPSCEEVNTCLVDAEREFNRDYADWAARQNNNASRRSHSVRFGCLKLNLKRGQTFGGGFIVTVTHGVTRESLSTSVTVVTAL